MAICFIREEYPENTSYYLKANIIIWESFNYYFCEVYQ